MRKCGFRRLAETAVLTIAAVLSCAAIKGQALTLTPAPASLSFTYQQASALPGAQTLAVRAGSTTAGYTVTVTNPDLAGQPPLWLTATPDTGKLPANLSVRVNSTGMAIGTYRATITVAVTGSTSAIVPVSLVISQPLPTLSLSRTMVAITAPPAKGTATVALSTTGAPISFTASVSGAPWLTVSPASGYVLPGAPSILTIAVDTSSLSPQVAPYSGKITIVAAGVPTASKSQIITVSLTLNSTVPTIAPPLWPQAVRAGAPDTTITIRGTGFYTGTTVKSSLLGGPGPATTITPTVLDSTIMLAILPATLLKSAQTLNVVASNPSGDSTAAAFTVSANPVVQAAVNLASYATTSVSPGEFITLFGAGIGPVAPALMADADGDGFIDTAVGGVTVTIDGVNSPILYVGQNQISVQVPYEASPGSGKVISVSNGGIVAQGTVTITLTEPAIFTLDGSGSGQAAALNSNFSLNAATNPAKPGDVIMLYITGEGDYASATFPKRTGYIVPTTLKVFPQINPLPTVSIGGANATVQYAGALPGSILGIMQLNVVVPAAATTNATTPVTVTIGGASAQTGVALSIHQ